MGSDVCISAYIALVIQTELFCRTTSMFCLPSKCTIKYFKMLYVYTYPDIIDPMLFIPFMFKHEKGK